MRKVKSSNDVLHGLWQGIFAVSSSGYIRVKFPANFQQVCFMESLCGGVWKVKSHQSI
jgi:hypothetical protein